MFHSATGCRHSSSTCPSPVTLSRSRGRHRPARLPHGPLPHPRDRDVGEDALDRAAACGRRALRDGRRRLRPETRPAVSEGIGMRVRLATVLHVKYDRRVDPRDRAGAPGRRPRRTRARPLSAARKRELASLGETARARSLLAARRIEENFRYMAAVESLRGPLHQATKQKRFDGRLPGIYPPKK